VAVWQGDDVITDDFHMLLHSWLEIPHMGIHYITVVTKTAWGFFTHALPHAEVHIRLSCKVSIDQNSNVLTDFSKNCEYQIS
jgi:hypothetical protein